MGTTFLVQSSRDFYPCNEYRMNLYGRKFSSLQRNLFIRRPNDLTYVDSISHKIIKNSSLTKAGKKSSRCYSDSFCNKKSKNYCFHSKNSTNNWNSNKNICDISFSPEYRDDYLTKKYSYDELYPIESNISICIELNHDKISDERCNASNLISNHSYLDFLPSTKDIKDEILLLNQADFTEASDKITQNVSKPILSSESFYRYLRHTQHSFDSDIESIAESPRFTPCNVLVKSLDDFSNKLVSTNSQKKFFENCLQNYNLQNSIDNPISFAECRALINSPTRIQKSLYNTKNTTSLANSKYLLRPRSSVAACDTFDSHFLRSEKKKSKNIDIYSDYDFIKLPELPLSQNISQSETEISQILNIEDNNKSNIYLKNNIYEFQQDILFAENNSKIKESSWFILSDDEDLDNVNLSDYNSGVDCSEDTNELVRNLSLNDSIDDNTHSTMKSISTEYTCFDKKYVYQDVHEIDVQNERKYSITLLPNSRREIVQKELILDISDTKTDIERSRLDSQQKNSNVLEKSQIKIGQDSVLENIYLVKLQPKFGCLDNISVSSDIGKTSKHKHNGWLNDYKLNNLSETPILKLNKDMRYYNRGIKLIENIDNSTCKSSNISILKTAELIKNDITEFKDNNFKFDSVDIKPIQIKKKSYITCADNLSLTLNPNDNLIKKSVDDSLAFSNNFFTETIVYTKKRKFISDINLSSNKLFSMIAYSPKRARN